MLKDFFKNEEQLNDYNSFVDIFNENNPFKIGEKISIELSSFELTYKKGRRGYSGYTKSNFICSKIVEARIDLGLYGLSDDEQFKYEFQPVFIIGDEPVPEKGEEYGERVYWSGFTLKQERSNLPLKNNIRFNRMSYSIL